MSKIGSKFGWPTRVYHEDVDTMGVVYYANYLKFYERARTEYLRTKGFEQDQLMTEYGVMFVVRFAQIDYLKPARYNDLLLITAEVSSVKRSILQFDQKIFLNDEHGKCLNQSSVKVVCVDSDKFKLCRIPTEIINSYQ